MTVQQVSPVQVQMAAAAGVQLLSNPDLPVPMAIAKTGNLSILEGILQSLAQGQVVLAAPPPDPEAKKSPPKKPPGSKGPPPKRNGNK